MPPTLEGPHKQPFGFVLALSDAVCRLYLQQAPPVHLPSASSHCFVLFGLGLGLHEGPPSALTG